MGLHASRNHSAAFKAKGAMAALKGGQLHAVLAERFDVHPNQITQWRAERTQRAAGSKGTPRPDRTMIDT